MDQGRMHAEKRSNHVHSPLIGGEAGGAVSADSTPEGPWRVQGRVWAAAVPVAVHARCSRGLAVRDSRSTPGVGRGDVEGEAAGAAVWGATGVAAARNQSLRTYVDGRTSAPEALQPRRRGAGRPPCCGMRRCPGNCALRPVLRAPFRRSCRYARRVRGPPGPPVRRTSRRPALAPRLPADLARPGEPHPRVTLSPIKEIFIDQGRTRAESGRRRGCGVGRGERGD
jgi:hypothetical protein